MLFYGLFELSLVYLMLVAAIMGFFLIGAMIGLYLSPHPFTRQLSESSGVGLAIGIGRVGAIVAPLQVELSWIQGTATMKFLLSF